MSFKIESKVVIPLDDPVKAAKMIQVASDIGTGRGGDVAAHAAGSGADRPGVVIIHWVEEVDA